MIVGYKVVEVTEDGEMVSFMGRSCLRGFEVEYIIGEESKPKDNCGPLAIFKTLANAKLFASYDESNILYRLLQVNYNKKDVVEQGVMSSSLHKYALWITYTYGVRGFTWFDLPSGTILVNKLISTKIIKTSD